MTRRRGRSDARGPAAPPPAAPDGSSALDERPIPWELYLAPGVPPGYHEWYVVDEAERVVFRLMVDAARWDAIAPLGAPRVRELIRALRVPDRPPLTLVRGGRR